MTDIGDDQTQPHLRDPGVAAVLRCKNPSMLENAAAQEIRLEGDEVTIGRGSDNSVTLATFGISRHHARLYRSDGQWHVEDRGSTNGTRVNNKRVTTRVLANGDTVAFGRVGYVFLTAHAAGGGFASGLATALMNDEQRTLVIGPARRGETAEAHASRQAPAASGNEQVYDTGTHPRHLRASGSAPRSGTALWILVLVIACAAGATAAYFLGLIG